MVNPICLSGVMLFEQLRQSVGLSVCVRPLDRADDLRAMVDGVPEQRFSVRTDPASPSGLQLPLRCSRVSASPHGTSFG